MEVRELRGDDELQQVWQLVRRAFNVPAGDFDGWRDRLDPARTRVVVEANRVAAFSRILPFGIFLGGRSVPMGGYSPVATAPELRGRGYASAATTAHFADLRTRGEVVAALYPASTTLYRGVGFEVAGVWSQRSVPARSLQALRGEVDVRPAGRGDLPAIRACYRRAAAGVDGHLDRPEQWWRRILDDVWAERHVYVVDGAGGELNGYVVYEHTPPERDWGYGIRVRELVAPGTAAARTLWGLVGSSSTMVDQVVAVGPPEHPLLLLLDEQDVRARSELRYMLRVVDAPGAVAARGFPRGSSVAVDVTIEDAHCPWNSGDWRLTVADGRGVLEPGRAGGAVLTSQGIAALYGGYARMAVLRASGRARGGDARSDAVLDAAFAGATPWMADFF